MKTGELCSYITGILRNKNCKLYRINGTNDHLHILTDIHPSLALADLMRDIKVSTSVWIKEQKLLSAFDGWAEGYGSFTCSFMDLARLNDYIVNQQDHHKKKSFEEEYRILLMESGIRIDERYFP
jgi:REP element-mobilizing transposase RayT